MNMMDMAKPVVSERDYLQKMIPHHELALTMSHQVLAEHPSVKVRALANKIISAQTVQIAEMKTLLSSEQAGRAHFHHAPPGANAPYKIVKRGSRFAVVDNAGITKATFPTRTAALAYQRALYVNVPGAAKRAETVKYTGKAVNRVKVEKSDADDSVVDLAEAIDATVDEAMKLLAGATDPKAMQVLALLQGLDAVNDKLLKLVHGVDADEPEKSAANKMPYGNVAYADPGYQADKKKRYPLDTEAHVRAALAYINKGLDADKYTGANLSLVRSRIYAAAKKFGIKTAK